MSRHRYVIRDGQLVELDLDAPLPPRKTPYIISDIGHYRSTVTGEVIDGRSQHREHLKAHGCVELGNDMPKPAREPLPPLVPSIERALQASPETHAEARAAVERATKAVPGDA